MTAPLRRCACNKGEARVIDLGSIGTRPCGFVVVCASTCPAGTRVCDTEAAAIAEWNGPPDITAAVAALASAPDITRDNYTKADVDRLKAAMNVAWAELTKHTTPPSVRRTPPTTGAGA